MRRTLEITSHLLTYREGIYARIHFGAYVHAADGGQKYEYVFEKSQAVFTATWAAAYYFAVKFKRYLNGADKVGEALIIRE